MGPQYAAYWGLMAQGSLPRVGDSQLLVEVSPSNAVFPLTDVAMKRTSVRSAGTLVERDFGLMELHADTPDSVLEAADAILGALGMGWGDRIAPTVVSSQLLSNITPDHSQLFNKVRRGAWTLPGDTLYVLETSPAAWVYLIANEVEKGVDIELVRVAGTGLYGRLIVAGIESAATDGGVDRARRDRHGARRMRSWPVNRQEVVEMQLARVVGNAVASVKEPRLTGTTLLLVEDATVEGLSAGGPAYVAVDLVGAGEPELVLVVRGSTASRAVGVEGAPIDAAVVAILDHVRAGGRSTYEKG